ncbi:hypothetical protein ACFQZ4_11810 [Catellatospora coxensis]
MIEDLAALVAVESPSEDPRATAHSADAVTALGSRLLGSSPNATARTWSGGTAAPGCSWSATTTRSGRWAPWPAGRSGSTATGPPGRAAST